MWSTPSAVTQEHKKWLCSLGIRNMDSGQWTVDSGRWTVDSGQWTVDSGQWTVDSGQLTMNRAMGNCNGQWTASLFLYSDECNRNLTHTMLNNINLLLSIYAQNYIKTRDFVIGRTILPTYVVSLRSTASQSHLGRTFFRIQDGGR
jgi:hypothetical protein